MKKHPPDREATDRWGNSLQQGDRILYPHSASQTREGVIKNIGPKMVTTQGGKRIHHNQCVKVPKEVLMRRMIE